MTTEKTNFTEQKTKDMLNHLINAYLDDDSKNGNMTFGEMVRATAGDLGLSESQIRAAFSHPRVATIVANLERSQNNLVMAGRKLVDHLKKPFAYKVGFDFTQQEAQEIWRYTQSEYLDKREYELRKFDEAIKAVAGDLGLTPRQVRMAISGPDRATFKKLERAHDARVKLHFRAVRWVESAGCPKIIRTLGLAFLWKRIAGRKSRSR